MEDVRIHQYEGNEDLYDKVVYHIFTILEGRRVNEELLTDLVLEYYGYTLKDIFTSIGATNIHGFFRKTGSSILFRVCRRAEVDEIERSCDFATKTSIQHMFPYAGKFRILECFAARSCLSEGEFCLRYMLIHKVSFDMEEIMRLFGFHWSVRSCMTEVMGSHMIIRNYSGQNHYTICESFPYTFQRILEECTSETNSLRRWADRFQTLAKMIEKMQEPKPTPVYFAFPQSGRKPFKIFEDLGDGWSVSDDEAEATKCAGYATTYVRRR